METAGQNEALIKNEPKLHTLSQKEADGLLKAQEAAPDQLDKTGLQELKSMLEWQKENPHGHITEVRLEYQKQRPRKTFVGMTEEGGEKQFFFYPSPDLTKKQRDIYKMLLSNAVGQRISHLHKYIPETPLAASTTETVGSGLFDQLHNEQKDPRLVERQKRILEDLSPNLIEELTGHLKALYIDQAKFPTFNPKEPGLDRKALKGELFERVVEAEDRLYHLDPEDDHYPQSTEQAQIAARILEVMANPDRFNIPMHAISNPDIAKLIFDKGVLRFAASLEVKTKMNEHTMRQLHRFTDSLNRICHVVNNLSDPQEHGLPGLGKQGNQISVSEDYYQIIVIPRGQSLTNTDGGPSRFISKEMPPEKREELLKLLTTSKKVKIVRSSFNNHDLILLTNYLEDRIKEKLTQETEQLV